MTDGVIFTLLAVADEVGHPPHEYVLRWERRSRGGAVAMMWGRLLAVRRVLVDKVDDDWLPVNPNLARVHGLVEGWEPEQGYTLRLMFRWHEWVTETRPVHRGMKRAHEIGGVLMSVEDVRRVPQVRADDPWLKGWLAGDEMPAARKDIKWER